MGGSTNAVVRATAELNRMHGCLSRRHGLCTLMNCSSCLYLRRCVHLSDSTWISIRCLHRFTFQLGARATSHVFISRCRHARQHAFEHPPYGNPTAFTLSSSSLVLVGHCLCEICGCQPISLTVSMYLSHVSATLEQIALCQDLSLHTFREDAPP